VAIGLCVTLFGLVGTAGAGGSGDPAAGERLYARCAACHSLQRNRTGPRHCGLIGRPAGGLADFDYSEALVGSGLVWDAETLDRFLADPTGSVPGTAMGYAGVKDPAERADLIAFLVAVNRPGGPCD
jgi:cytochrome c